MKITAMRWIKYFGDKANHVFSGVVSELSENRAILNWIYAAAYLALIFYCVVNNPGSHNTAIVTTGGIIGTIFSAYVAASSYEKVAQMRLPKAAVLPQDMTEKDQEDAAGD